MVLSELSFVPEPSLLQFWYFKQIQNFKPMAEDIAHYRRCQWNNSPDYSVDWRGAASCRYLAQKRADYMQESLNKSLTYVPKYGTAAPAVDEGKGKGKRQGQRQR